MRRRTFLAGSGSLVAGIARAEGAVDLLLVLAVDVSGSITRDEARLQRQGYSTAMTDPRVMTAIAGGAAGAIAVAYVEWAGYERQKLLIPWTRLGGMADGAAWADTLLKSPWESLHGTSLSGALTFCEQLLGSSPFAAGRHVIDVSGDGPNNNGPAPEPIRDRLVADGVTINGLPIFNPIFTYGLRDGQTIEDYYRESVIGGMGSFLIVARDFASFGDAIRRKLVQEIAGGGGRSPAEG